MKPRIFVAYFGAVFNVGTFSLAGCTADVFVVQVVFRFPRRVTGFGPERPNLKRAMRQHVLGIKCRVIRHGLQGVRLPGDVYCLKVEWWG